MHPHFGTGGSLITTSALAILLAVSGSLLGVNAGPATAQPVVTRVWAYEPNDEPGCKFAVWLLMGFIQSDLSFGTIQGTDVIVDGQDKGDVVQPGRFRNAAGTAEAFDLSARTFAEAYTVIAATDDARLTQCGHGLADGGALWLDNNTKYAGFGSGTGAKFGAPYPIDLPGAEGQNVTVHLHSCYSSKDPDGAGGPQISVVASLQDDLDEEETQPVNVTGHLGTSKPVDMVTEKGAQPVENPDLENLLCEGASVGGIAESVPEEVRTRAALPGGSGPNAGGRAGIAFGAAAGVVVLGGAGWYTRKRLISR